MEDVNVVHFFPRKLRGVYGSINPMWFMAQLAMWSLRVSEPLHVRYSPLNPTWWACTEPNVVQCSPGGTRTPNLVVTRTPDISIGLGLSLHPAVGGVPGASRTYWYEAPHSLVSARSCLPQPLRQVSLRITMPYLNRV